MDEYFSAYTLGKSFEHDAEQYKTNIIQAGFITQSLFLENVQSEEEFESFLNEINVRLSHRKILRNFWKSFQPVQREEITVDDIMAKVKVPKESRVGAAVDAMIKHLSGSLIGEDLEIRLPPSKPF
jgi:hypothetical protein